MSFGARLSTRLVAILLRVSVALTAWLPLRALGPIGSALGFVVGSVVRYRRRHVEEAMDRAHVSAPHAVASSMYARLGRALVRLLWLAGGRASDEETWAMTIDPEAIRALDEAKRRGPVILSASHTGNWELAAAAAAARWPIAVVAKPMSVRAVDELVAGLRARLGVRTIAPAGAFGLASRALARGDVVVMPIDQVPDRAAHGLRMPFMDQEALVDRAPATLAWRANATVLVVAASTPDGRDDGVVRLLGVLAPPSEQEPARDFIERTTREATTLLDRFVRQEPASWLWLHKRWRATPRRTSVTRARELKALSAREAEPSRS